MRRGRIAGLSRRVRSHRRIPVARIHDDSERRAAALIPRAGRTDGESIAAARRRADVELPAQGIAHRRAHRMMYEYVMILHLSPLPCRHLGPEAPREIGDRRLEAPAHDRVPPPDR